MQDSASWYVSSLARPSSTLLGYPPGSSESGKSTIVKQMRIIHQDGFSYETKISYREAIYSNLLESAQAVAAAMHKFKVEPADPSNVVSSLSDIASLVSFSNPRPRSKHWNRCWNTISIPSCTLRRVLRPPLSSRPNLRMPYSVSGRTRRSRSLPTILGHSSTLWTARPSEHPGCSRDQDPSHYLSSFFTEAQRIASADYVPTETDILRCRQRSTGIIETRFSVPPLS